MKKILNEKNQFNKEFKFKSKTRKFKSRYIL